MRHAILSAAIALVSLVGAGCAKDSTASDRHSMSADACQMCAGHQTATADGKCPVCGMSVAAMNEPTKLDKTSQMQKMPTTRSGAMMDQCPKCPGTQTLTADGTCPMCGGRPT